MRIEVEKSKIQNYREVMILGNGYFSPSNYLIAPPIYGNERGLMAKHVKCKWDLKKFSAIIQCRLFEITIQLYIYSITTLRTALPSGV